MQVLQQVPASVPLRVLSEFVTQATQRLVHRMQATQVTRHVESAQHMARTLELLQRQQAHALITKDSVCPVTGARIVERGAFLRFPNGVVTVPLHNRPLHICPVSGRNFRDEPVEEKEATSRKY